MSANDPAMPAPKKARSNGFLASGAGLMAIKLLNAGLGFLTVTVFARFMAPETFGLYVLVLTISQFLAMPLQMGIPILLTREIAVADSQERPAVIAGIQLWTRRIVVRGTLVLSAVLIGAFALIRALEWPVLQDFTWPMVLLAVLLIPAIAEMKRVMGVLNGYRKPAQSRMPDGVIRPVMLVAAGGLGLWAGWFLETGLLAVHLGAAVLAALFGWTLVQRAQGPRYAGPVEIHAVDWWRALGPLTLFAAAGTIKTYADVLMLGAMVGPEVTAFYRVAVQFAAIALLVQVAINAVFSPHMAALHAKDEMDAMQGLAVRGSRIAFAFTLVVALGVILLGADGFAWVLGAAYAPVYPLAVALSLGTAINAVFGGTTMMLNMTRREKSSATYAVGTAVANVALNIALIPVLGGMGAAISTVLTTLAMQLLSWSRLRKDLGIRTDAFAKRLQ